VVLRGLRNTLVLTVLAMAIGVAGGLLLAIMRLSTNLVLKAVVSGYIWLFRGTPVITQLVFWNFLAALFPRLGLGIPFGPELVSVDTNSLIDLFSACLLGLGLNEAAYMAEIVRGGIGSVDHGQNEAASALGMSRAQTLRRIVLLQAMRVIIPPTGNETISMLKTTSLVVVIGFFELQTAVQSIYSRNFQTIPLLIVAALWYLALTSMPVGRTGLPRALLRARHSASGRPAVSSAGGSAGPAGTRACRWCGPNRCAKASAATRCCGASTWSCRHAR
jgi:polar amino acid transport system permease protein